MANNLLMTIWALGGFMLCSQAIGADTMPADSPAGPKAQQIDACTLLNPTEISRTIGFPVDKGKRTDAGFQSNGAYSSACLWVIQQGKAVTPDPFAPLDGKSFVILNAMQWPAGSGLARTFLEAFHSAAAEGTIPNAPIAKDFGDEALWWGDGLAVRKLDVSFGVSVFMPGLKPKPAGKFEEQLAPYILRRLDQRSANARPVK